MDALDVLNGTVTAAILIVVGSAALVAVALLVSGGAPEDLVTNGPVTVLGAAVTQLAFVGAVAVVVLRHRSLTAVGLRSIRPGWQLFVWLSVAVGIGVAMRIVTVIAALIVDRLGLRFDNPQEGLFEALTQSAVLALALILIAGVLTPLTEEVFFRGVWYGGLRRHMPWWGAMVISSVVFSAAHALGGPNPLLLGATAVIGAINALLYERTKSIWPAVVVHLVFNLSALIPAVLLSRLGAGA